MGRNPFNTSTWYLFSGTLAVTLGLVATGCRFGNKVETVDSSDGITGYYATEVKSARFCAVHTSNICNDVTADYIPASVALVMTDPVALVVQNKATGQALLSSNDLSTAAFSINLKDDSKLSYLYASAPGTFWDDPGCRLQKMTTRNGAYERAPFPARNADGLNISGSLSLVAKTTFTIDGQCVPTLQALYDCYNSSAACGGADATENNLRQQSVLEFYNPFIDAGVMTINDIKTALVLEYEASYE